MTNFTRQCLGHALDSAALLAPLFLPLINVKDRQHLQGFQTCRVCKGIFVHLSAAACRNPGLIALTTGHACVIGKHCQQMSKQAMDYFLDACNLLKLFECTRYIC